MTNTVRQLMYGIRLYYGTECSTASSWRQARTKIFFVPPMKQIPLIWYASYLIDVAINFVYEYFSFVIYFSNIFFIKTFFQNVFFKICFQLLFSKKFFSNFFLKFVFWGFTLDALPFTETKRTLCICVMGNMIYRSIQHSDYSIKNFQYLDWYYALVIILP